MNMLSAGQDRGYDNLLTALQKNLEEASRNPSKVDIGEELRGESRDVLANFIEDLEQLKTRLLETPKQKFIKDWTGLDLENSARQISQDSRAAFLPFGAKGASFGLKVSRRFQTPHELPLTALANIGNELLATGSRDGSINLIQYFEGVIVNTLVGHTDAITTLGVFKCSELQEYDHKREGIPRRTSSTASKPLYLMSGSGGMDSSVKIWDPETGELVRNLEGHEQSVTAVADLGDECTVATAGLDGNIVIWNALKCEAIQLLERHERGISCLQMMRCGKRLAAGGNDGVVTIWGIQFKSSNRPKRAVQNLFFERSFEIGSPILSMNACSIDTRYLLVAFKGLVQVFDVESGDSVQEFPTNSLGEIILVENLHAEPFKEDFMLINPTSDDKLEQDGVMGTFPSIQLIQANDWHLKLARITPPSLSNYVNPTLTLYDVV